MILYLEMAVLWFAVTTVVHGLVAVYFRSLRREKLEKEFDAGGVAGDRDAYVSVGMQAYKRGLLQRLIGVIWVLPLVLFVSVVYVVNYQ